MIFSIGFTVFFLVAPAIVLVLCRKVRWIGKLGPILTLYLLGVIVGNVCIIPGVELPETSHVIQHTLSSITVPFAIPLMLLGCTFDRKEAGGHIVALFTGLTAVIVAIVTGFFIFGPAINSSNMSIDGAAKIGGLLTGAYTGGTINMAALKTMLGVTDSTYLLLNGYDMIIGFLYLVFLVSVGIKLFRRILSDKCIHNDIVEDKKEDDNPYRGLGTRKGLWVLVMLSLYSLVVIGISYCVTLLFPNVPMMTIFILSLTTFSIAASFIQKLKVLPYSNEIGMYSIYIFSISVASMADIRTLDIAGGIGALGYLAFVVFASLAVQALLSKLFHVDADITVITSVAFLCSPPFVPMISAAMHNKKVLAAGLAIGVVGYAVGTYLGFGIYKLLI